MQQRVDDNIAERRAGRRQRWSALALAALVIMLVAACQRDNPAAPYHNYVTRLGRTLQVDVPDSRAAALPKAPRPARLSRSITRGQLDVLDFLALRGCELQVTIGKLNSSLGRFAKPSQRLLLALEFLRLAPACITYQQTLNHDSLATVLQQAWQLRRRQLPAMIYNATLASEEYRAFWRVPPRAAADYPENTSSAVISALTGINALARRWLGGDYRADNLQFELLLSDVTTGDGGALLQALDAQTHWLARADEIVARRMARGPLCAASRRYAAADILPNVIYKYFIHGVQPRAAALNRRYHQLLPPIRQLEDLLANVVPANYRSWQTAREERFTAAADAPPRHVKKLQTIRRPCLPGDSANPLKPATLASSIW